MNKLSLLLVPLILLAAPMAYSQTTQFGFYPLSSPSLPPAIVAAADSVFELRVLAAGDLNATATVDVSDGKGAQVKADIQNKEIKDFDEIDRIVVLKQIERCEKDPDIEEQRECGITFDIHRGSGFLSKNGSFMWTNAHVVEGFMDALEKLGGISKSEQFKNKREMRVFVFNKDGQLVLDPFVDEIRLVEKPELTFSARARDSFYAEDSDFVGLSLSRSIGKPLPIATEKPRVGQRIYIIGYPTCTACAPPEDMTEDREDYLDRSPAPNSAGKGMSVSFGDIVNLDELAPFFGLSPFYLDFYEKKQMLFNTADSQHGNSGGPILNEKGEVVAVHTGAKSRIIDGHHKRISRAVIPPQFGLSRN